MIGQRVERAKLPSLGSLSIACVKDGDFMVLPGNGRCDATIQATAH
jgi:hypothetical protein